jgi:hypothetical protein
LELYSKPVQEYKNKFVVTEDNAYFIPCVEDTDVPWFKDILNEIFNLDDPEVHKRVDDRLAGERIILGYFDPSNEEIIVHTPLETSEYVEKRFKEIFGEDV